MVLDIDVCALEGLRDRVFILDRFRLNVKNEDLTPRISFCYVDFRCLLFSLSMNFWAE